MIFLLMISSIFSNAIILFQNDRYEKCYQSDKNIEMVAIITSQKTEKQYYDLYQVKVLHSKHFNLFIQVSKQTADLAYGDKIKIQGEYIQPSDQRNYGGYNDKQYLKTLKITGRVKVNQLEIVAKQQLNLVLQYANTINLKIKEKITSIFQEEKAVMIKGLLLGETDRIEEEVKSNFQISNISHILAVSGMHISYIIMGIQLLFKKTMGKRRTKMVTIILLIGYAFITGFSPSVVRAVVMGIITLGGGILYRKSDVGNSIAISLLGILCYNPFLMLNTGLQLSYLGTIGIILFQSTISKIFENHSSRKKLKAKKKSKIREKGKEVIAVSLSAQIMIFPIMIYYFNSIGIYFLITNLLVSVIIGPIIIIGFFCIIASFIFMPIARLLAMPLGIGVDFFILISQFSQLPLAKIYLPTPSWIVIILYFIVIVMANQIYRIYYPSSSLTLTQKRVKNIIALFQYKFRQKKKKYLVSMIIGFVILASTHFIPNNLAIYFVDVGQGDCTLIVTPRNKTILIDGGGSLLDHFDVGKKTLIPYLLDRGFTSIDYVMISHFDQDHVRTD